MSFDPKDCDFATHSFEHGAHHKFTKREIATHLGTRLTVTAQGHIETKLNEGGILIERRSTKVSNG